MDLQFEINKLNGVKQKIISAINDYENKIGKLKKEIDESNEYLREHRAAMSSSIDPDIGINGELPERMEELDNMILHHNTSMTNLEKLKFALPSPYFGGFDFNGENFLIGKLGVTSPNLATPLVYDWRAPISSMFYDFENGPAHYIVPGVAKYEGVLANKKQYKIEDGKMVYCFETNINIQDEILQRTLAQNATSKMKTIVSTIQKEQNKIIRRATDQTIVVQGVAGSGKTSIALNRIAYLLYNNRKSLSSENVLIFSPNRVFSNYISNVLPELGEQLTKETSFDQILLFEFKDVCKVEKKFEQIETLLSGNSKRKREFETKTSMQFLNDLKAFLEEESNRLFKACPIKFAGYEISASDVQKYFNEESGKSFFDKLQNVCEGIVSYVNLSKPLSDLRERNLHKQILTSLLKSISPNDKNIFDIYNRYLKTKGMHLSINPVLKFEDGLYLLYIKNYMFGAQTKQNIKYVVIDELQDYPPVALEIIEQRYPCPKTALGDISQRIDGNSEANYIEIANKIFKTEIDVLELNTVYRATVENTVFTNKILSLTNVKCVERHGSEPVIISSNESNFAKNIANMADYYQNKGYKTIGILTKTFAEAKSVYSKVKDSLDVNLISPISERFNSGIVVCPTYLSKGLEFDAVIVCDANSENYKTEIDKQQLYVACTRALHDICVVHTGKLTKFIEE